MKFRKIDKRKRKILVSKHTITHVDNNVFNIQLNYNIDQARDPDS